MASRDELRKLCGSGQPRGEGCARAQHTAAGASHNASSRQRAEATQLGSSAKQPVHEQHSTDKEAIPALSLHGRALARTDLPRAQCAVPPLESENGAADCSVRHETANLDIELEVQQTNPAGAHHIRAAIDPTPVAPRKFHKADQWQGAAAEVTSPLDSPLFSSVLCTADEPAAAIDSRSKVPECVDAWQPQGPQPAAAACRQLVFETVVSASSGQKSQLVQNSTTAIHGTLHKRTIGTSAAVPSSGSFTCSHTQPQDCESGNGCLPRLEV
jgi:hypothetical protein